MLKQKIIILIMIGIFVLCSCPGYALTPAKMDTSKREKTATPRNAKKIVKIAGVVKKIDGRFLYLVNEQKYSLSGVKVVDYSGKTKSDEGPSRIRKIAEMTFIDGTLKEVVIR